MIDKRDKNYTIKIHSPVILFIYRFYISHFANFTFHICVLQKRKIQYAARIYSPNTYQSSMRSLEAIKFYFLYPFDTSELIIHYFLLSCRWDTCNWDFHRLQLPFMTESFRKWCFLKFTIVRITVIV